MLVRECLKEGWSLRVMSEVAWFPHTKLNFKLNLLDAFKTLGCKMGFKKCPIRRHKAREWCAPLFPAD